MARLVCPIRLFHKEQAPIARLLFAASFANSALRPTAIFPLPIVLFFNAEYP